MSEIQPEDHPVVGIQTDGVPLFLLGYNLDNESGNFL